MRIVNDFKCPSCGTVEEHWTERPAPADIPCSACGSRAQRLIASPRLNGRASEPAPVAATSKRSASPLCTQYPMLPGLCHMSPEAGRMWVAKNLGDSRAVDREQERQERRAAVTPYTTEDAVTHHHHLEASRAPSLTGTGD